MDRHVNRAGATQTFAPYDNRNRPTSFTWSDGTQGLSFEYDVASRITALHNTEADITFGYDAANRKTSETETIKSYGLNQTHTVTYEYDPDGTRSRLLYPHGFDYRYSYTNRNQLANVRVASLSNPSIQYTYDSAGNRDSRTTYAGAYTTYEFNELNRLRSQTSYFAGGRTARFDYGFDAADRIKYEQRDSGLADGFGYDLRNELTGFNNNGTLNQDGSVSAPYNVSITYDSNGNRIEVYDGYHARYSTGPSNQYTSDWTGGLGYDYNANLTSRNGWNFTYDAQNRLVAIDNNGTNIHIHQHYDGLNRIVGRDENGNITTNLWDNWDLLEERFSNDSLQRMYVHGGATNELAVSWGATYGDVYYFQDGRGNTTHLTDDSNNVIEHYTYLVAGQPSYFDGSNNSMSGSLVSNRFLFGGAQLVPQTEIYDMRNRFYLPNLGRFLQADPMGLQTEGAKLTPEQKALYGAGASEAFAGSEMNLFRYCGDDPVDRSDPTGLDATGANWNPDAANFFGYTSPGEYLHDVGQVFVGEGKGALNVISLGFYHPSYANDNQQFGGVVGQGATIVAAAILLRGEPAKPVGEIPPSTVIGKTPAQIDAAAERLGLSPRGPNPSAGQGSYIDPVTGEQRILSHPNAEPPHAHVNNPAGQRIGPDGNIVSPNSPEAHLPIKIDPKP